MSADDVDATRNARLLLSRPEADVHVTETPGDPSRYVRVTADKDDFYVHRSSIRTTYPDDLLLQIVEAKGVGFLCDEIARDQEHNYLERHLVATLSAHTDPASLAGLRLLDFGCGAGASTSILGRLLPDTEIVGVELEESFLDVARARAEFYGRTNVEFHRSPDPGRLPDSIGKFDVVVLSAVFEHLLPAERRSIMPMVWETLKPGGVLYIDETPWRWFPIETHTTGIPMLNYLPKSAARRLAARLPKLRGRTTWPELQRAGVRGGTTREITRSLGKNAQFELRKPSRLGIDNWVDLWFEGYALGTSGRRTGLKRSSRTVLKGVYRATGVAAIPYLSLAIRKTN